jgi:hypothetical protein
MANGIPQLLNNTSNAINTIVLLIADSQTVVNMFGAPKWGIFQSQSTTPLLVPDSVVSVDIRQDWRVSDYPIEPNSFESYNKVIVPGEIRIVMSKGGSDSERKDFMDAFDNLGDSLVPFDIVMPDGTWPSFTLSHYSLRRTATNGVTLITVELWCTRINISVATESSVTASPSGTSPIPSGPVQPQAAPPSAATVPTAAA